MKKMLYNILLLSTLCYSCQETKTTIVNVKKGTPPTRGAFKDYTIKKGKHFSLQNGVNLFTAPEIVAWVKFDSSAIYSTKKKDNQGDVNKLIGFSDCGTLHHKNSARLGWSWDGDNVVLYAYAYVNNKRVIKTLGAVRLNEVYSCSVRAENEYYYFRLGDQTDSIGRYCKGNGRFRYKLFPYFGGDETAPHDMHIYIWE